MDIGIKTNVTNLILCMQITQNNSLILSGCFPICLLEFKVKLMINHPAVVLTIISFLFLFVCACPVQHAPTGFYVLIESKTNCTNLVHAFKGTDTYCLPDGPIIVNTEFESVSDIKIDKQKQVRYFNLKLSPEGFTILKTLSDRLPQSRLALVIDGLVAGIFESNGKLVNRILPINGGINAPEIDWIHYNLKRTKPK